MRVSYTGENVHVGFYRVRIVYLEDHWSGDKTTQVNSVLKYKISRQAGYDGDQTEDRMYSFTKKIMK